MFWRKFKVFWWNHWPKVVVIAWIFFIFYWPSQSLGSLDKYQRDYMIAFLSMTGLQATVSAVIFVVLYSWVLQGGMQKLRKSQIKGDKVNIHWKDVIGMESAKAEAREVVELIKDRSRIKKIGGNIIRGMLMMGPPGCGKTYLAKAMATEAGVPFISMSGSEFTEMYVGVGASRVRQLFNKARKLAYADGGCIIFIDEIDAIGHKRVHDTGFGGMQERNTTLNQLLVEMDGLGDKQENIVVLGATNAPETIMDDALLRAGRFDRKIFVRKPNLQEREDLFRFYLSKVKSDESVDVGKISRKMVGSSPADIANLTKEAALIAIRTKDDKIREQHLLEAMDRIYLGLKSNITMNQKDKIVTAYHETGHLIALYLLHPTDDVFKATIIPRGGALGLVSHLPPDDKYSIDRDEILADIKICLAGYVAEKIKFNTTSGGVITDFEMAMRSAHRMVWDIGMGRSGWVGNYSTIPTNQLSEDIKQKLNSETQQILQDCLKDVEELLKNEHVIFERFAQELIQKEELDYDDIEAIFKEYGKSNPRISSKYIPVK